MIKAKIDKYGFYEVAQMSISWTQLVNYVVKETADRRLEVTDQKGKVQRYQFDKKGNQI